MIPPEYPLAALALALAVAAGLVAHEWAHALALRLARVEYDLEYFPGRDADSSLGALAAVSSGPWAVVRPRPTGEEPPWQLRVAAMMPLALTVPVLALAASGHLTESAEPAVAAAAIGWLACAIPSPQDFSVAFYAHAALDLASPSGHADDPHSGAESRADAIDPTQAESASRAD